MTPRYELTTRPGTTYELTATTPMAIYHALLLGKARLVTPTDKEPTR